MIRGAGIALAIWFVLFMLFQAPQVLVLLVVAFVIAARRRAKKHRFDSFVEAMLK